MVLAFYGVLWVFGGSPNNLAHPGRVLYGRGYRLEAFTRTKSKTDSFSTTEKNQNSEGDEFGVFTGHARAMRGILFVLA
jgi:hypothetical protein